MPGIMWRLLRSIADEKTTAFYCIPAYPALVDVDNCLYFEYEMPNEWVERDPEAENNGYQLMRKLDSNEMKSFFRSASLWGFWSWSGEYDNRTVQDGDTWEVIITYKKRKNPSGKRILQPAYDVETGF